MHIGFESDLYNIAHNITRIPSGSCPAQPCRSITGTLASPSRTVFTACGVLPWTFRYAR